MKKEISYRFNFSVYVDVAESLSVLDDFYTTGIINELILKGISVGKKDKHWSLISALIYSYNLSDILNGFITDSLLRDCTQMPVDGSNTTCLFVKVEIWSGSTMPGIHLDKSVLEFLANKKCEIDIDIYDYRK